MSKKVQQTLNSMMEAGKAVLKETGNPKMAWEAAKKENNLPPTLWDKYIKAAMVEDMWYAIASKVVR